MNEINICKICNSELKSRNALAGHIGTKHKISIETYFITYIMTEPRPLCPICNKETRFNKGIYTFQEYCIEHANEARKKWTKENSKMDFGWRKGLTKETHEGIKRQSEYMIGENNPFYGKHHSEETKKKIKQNHIKNKVSVGENNPMYGKKHSEDVIEKLKLIEKKKGENHVNSKLTNLQRFEIIQNYKNKNITQIKLAKIYNVSQKTISYIIKKSNYYIDLYLQSLDSTLTGTGLTV